MNPSSRTGQEKSGNFRMPLSHLFFPDGRDAGLAEIVSVSDLTVPDAVDSKGVSWRAHVLKDYVVQKTAVDALILNEGAELLPKYAISILKDPDELFYTVMTLIVPSRRHSHGFKAVGMIRPDVVSSGRVVYTADQDMTLEKISSLYNADGGHLYNAENPENELCYLDGEAVRVQNPQLYGKLWFGPVVKPEFDNARFSSGSSIYDTLLIYALTSINRQVARAMAAEGKVAEAGFVFGDNVPNLPRGFKVLLRNLDVPDLRAEGSEKDVAVNKVDLTVIPSPKHPNGVPLNLAAEHTIDYLVNGYDAPINGELVRYAVNRLQSEAVGRVVPYK